MHHMMALQVHQSIAELDEEEQHFTLTRELLLLHQRPEVAIKGPLVVRQHHIPAEYRKV